MKDDVPNLKDYSQRLRDEASMDLADRVQGRSCEVLGLASFQGGPRGPRGEGPMLF